MKVAQTMALPIFTILVVAATIIAKGCGSGRILMVQKVGFRA